MTTTDLPSRGRHRDLGGKRADRRLAIFELGYEEARRRAVEQLNLAYAAAAEIPELKALIAEIDFLNGTGEEPADETTAHLHTQLEWGVVFSYMTAQTGHVMPAFGNRQEATAYAEYVLASHDEFTFELATRSRRGEWHIVRTGRPVADLLAARSAAAASAGPTQVAA